MLNSPVTGPAWRVSVALSLPPPTLSPPQAASPSGQRDRRERHDAPAHCRVEFLIAHVTPPCCLQLRLPSSSAASPSHQVHVLGRPGKLYLGSSTRQLLALGLVGVGHQHGHPHSPGKSHDHLGRGAQVQRALDQALDARCSPRPPRPGDLELLGADDRLAAVAGREAVGVGVDRGAAVELDLALGPPS